MPTPCNAPSLLRTRAWLAGIVLASLAWLGGLPGTALAGTDPAATPPARPRIGLVLGGGGARGSAHVGVLKVLEEQRIPIDYIAGNSMGAIVGGLYASGMTPAEIEHELKTIDWDDVFDDEPPRPERSFRRKRDDDLYLVKPRAGLSDEGELKLPLALIQGQKFDLQLSRLTLHVANVHDFNQLPIPFRAVAADIETGKEVVLQSGSLARSIRASMAVPGAFDPVEIHGRLLVDGLVVNNVPVNVARDMGADILIVVDVGSGLYKREQIKNVLDVVAQLSNVLSDRNVERQLATLKPTDIYIQPDLGRLGAGDFDKAGEGIAKGEQAARKVIPRLQHLAVDPASYQQFLARRGTRAGPPVIQFVRLDNQSRLADETILSRLTLKPGEPLDRAKLDADIGLVYGLDVFESVRYEVVQENGQDGLVVHAKEKSWGPNYLQFGIELSNNFKGDSTYNLGALYTRTAINDLNGEIRVGLQLGQNPAAIAEWFQPLDPQSRYFTHFGTYIKQDQYSVYEDDDIVADYSILRGGIDLAVGRELGTWGEGRIGYRWAMGHGDVRIGDPSLDDYEFKLGQVYARLQLDTLDNVYFPHAGNRGRLEWYAAREAFGADSNYDQVVMQFTHAHSWGRNNLVGSLAFNSTLDDDAPPESRFRLGGFLRLSGYRPNQLSGQHAGIAGVMYYRRISDLKLLPAYLGGSLEYGNVWQDRDDIAFDSGLFNGSVFLGADTPIGPLYLGLGAGEGGNNTVFLYLGPLF